MTHYPNRTEVAMEIHNNQNHVNDDQDVDRISNLPDEIRCHILSFMPSKSALKMSVLSKQWKHLWTLIPMLDFSETPHLYMDSWDLTSQQITHFKNFVHKLLLHNDVPFLRFLHLDCEVFGWDNIRCINSCVDIIAKRDIREIKITYLCIGHQPQVALPTNFLFRERLVVLTLSGKFSIDDKMLLHLPNLETVCFFGLQFPNDEFLKRMLSSCLLLKDLTINCCTGISNSLIVESLSLRRLYISDVAHVTERAGIIIRTPSLKYLVLGDYLKQHVIADLRSLDVAFLNLMCENDDYALRVLQLVSGVTKLSLINSHYLRYISKPPKFQNLTCLKLDHAGKLCTVLGCASKLKYLIIELEACADKSLKSEAVPVCMSSLEVVHFWRFGGKEEEFELVEYILKFASMLKEMKIYIISPTRKTEYERLMKLPRSSNSCQLIATFGHVTKDLIKFQWHS